MAKSCTNLARELLQADGDSHEVIRICEFADEEDAHDPELHDRLHAEFSAEFDRVQTELSTLYGKPALTGDIGCEAIPLNGVFRHAVWQIGEKVLFVATAHDDRVLLVIGTAIGAVTCPGFDRRSAKR
jgi:hypothetical protein